MTTETVLPTKSLMPEKVVPATDVSTMRVPEPIECDEVIGPCQLAADGGCGENGFLCLNMTGGMRVPR